MTADSNIVVPKDTIVALKEREIDSPLTISSLGTLVFWCKVGAANTGY